MVSVVLHNACLRMEEEGADLDEILAPKGIQRWIGRSSLALGGAASLLVGAVFGGILESVPVLLPPPAAASATPSVVDGLPANTPWTLAADAAPAPAQAPAAVVAAVTAPAATGGRSISLPKPVNNSPAPVNNPLPPPPVNNPLPPPPPTNDPPPSNNPPPSPLQPVQNVVTQTVQTVQQVTSPVTQAVDSTTGTNTTGLVSGVTTTVVNTVQNAGSLLP
jgi:hypothetical protein